VLVGRQIRLQLAQHRIPDRAGDAEQPASGHGAGGLPVAVSAGRLPATSSGRRTLGPSPIAQDRGITPVQPDGGNPSRLPEQTPSGPGSSVASKAMSQNGGTFYANVYKRIRIHRRRLGYCG
jgi:hypothetical protein